MSGAHRCAVLGSPIGHSLSPALHRAAYAHLGLTDWTYDRFEVTEDDLVGFVADCDSSWRGLSLTMPLKVLALELGEVDEVAALVGAANTLVFAAEGPRVYNTDVGGLVSALRRAGVEQVDRVSVLGAGATARSSLVSVAQLGATQVSVLARDPRKVDALQPLAHLLGVTLTALEWHADLPAADLVVSTVTAGAADGRAESIVASAPVIFDAIYAPWPTVLARAAEAAGDVVVSGLDLLVCQAVLQFELMTGRAIDIEVLLAAGLAELDARSSG